MPKLLIVDDEKNIREVIKEYALFFGYDFMEADNGTTAIELCKNNNFSIIIMDIMMPKMDGYMASKEIKKINNTPILMLSARGEEYDKLYGFELGIDDYVVKPFSPKELMARINAIIKRNEKDDIKKVTYDGLEIDILGRQVLIDKKNIKLTPKEYDLLFYLVKNERLALSREQLLNDVWGTEFYGDDRTVDTHIKMLRHNLSKYRDYITTIRGVGYKFENRSSKMER
jgi:DNA-binding response OmpR family regulator